VQVVANVIDTPAPAASSRRAELPAGIDRVIARCLTKEPGGRFPSYAALRDALLPFSSAVPEPATQTQRGAAGWIDYLAAFLPTYAATMVLVGPVALFIRPLYEFTFAAWRYHFLIFAVAFLYFTLTEGLFGMGLGKWIMNLRVVRTNGRRPGLGRALLRIAIPMAVIEGVRIPLSVAALPSGEWAPIHTILNIGLAVACPWVVALLWIPANRGNGLATAWDLASGTRVVVRPKGVRRPAGSLDAQAEAHGAATRHIGPFGVTGEVAPGKWLSAEDAVLRRPIWLILRNGTELTEARRGAARPGRPRWLQNVESEERTWDAFEAPRGLPFGEIVTAGPVPWATMRYWLHDLAAELWAQQRDGTLPAEYSLGHIWITDDGRAMLLDTPWPGSPAECIAVGTLSGQQRFLAAVAEHADNLSIPLHARPALQNLRSGSFEKLTFLTGTFRGLLGKPAEVTRGLRSASLFVIPGYAWIASLLGIAGNTAATASWSVWAVRIAIAALVMMHFMAFFDILLALWRKSTGLSTFGLEAVTTTGRASRARMLARALLMWLPVLASTGVLAVLARMNGAWIDSAAASWLGGAAIAGAGVLTISAVVNPARGLHDRLAGVWIVRR
jgi:hypothetical protein